MERVDQASGQWLAFAFVTYQSLLGKGVIQGSGQWRSKGIHSRRWTSRFGVIRSRDARPVEIPFLVKSTAFT